MDEDHLECKIYNKILIYKAALHPSNWKFNTPVWCRWTSLNPDPYLVCLIHLHSAKMFLDNDKNPIFTEMLHIRQIKNIITKAGECPLHFDTKLEGIGLINNRVLII